MNFNLGQSIAGNWANTDHNPSSPRIFSNLPESTGSNTGYQLRMVDRWDGQNAQGMNTGNNSGVVPDMVMGTCWYVDVYTPTLRLTGLDTQFVYHLEFFGSRNGAGNRTTHYTVGSQTVSLDAAFNTSQTVRIEDISPNAAGEIDISIAKDAAASYGYLNAMFLEVASKESPISSLPVEWVSFAAEAAAGQVNLSWETAAEINHDYFSVERSTDEGQTFKALAQVAGQGVGAYQYQDRTAPSGQLHYRLQQVDLDGSFSYSELREVWVDHGQAGLSFRAFPNPWREELQVELTYAPAEPVEVRLFDGQGRIVYAEQRQGEYTWKLPQLSTLPPGIYYLQLLHQNQQMAFPLQKME
jgi:hypothetical protein